MPLLIFDFNFNLLMLTLSIRYTSNLFLNMRMGLKRRKRYFLRTERIDSVRMCRSWF